MNLLGHDGVIYTLSVLRGRAIAVRSAMGPKRNRFHNSPIARGGVQRRSHDVEGIGDEASWHRRDLMLERCFREFRWTVVEQSHVRAIELIPPLQEQGDRCFSGCDDAAFEFYR